MPASDSPSRPRADAGFQEPTVTVTEFVELVNTAFDMAFPSITITGELANLRVSKGRWVYFDLKDDTSSVKCFGTVFQLPGPLEDGLMLRVKGTPHLHHLYGFSVNVQTMQPAGEGSIRRAAELLKRQLAAEGLFDESRKRPLPYPPRHVGLITSSQSAAYADFIKILGARWGGLTIELIDVGVQGDAAAGQIISAVNQFSESGDPPEVVVLIRGGGSADDLAVFSHEQVTRAVAASRIPTLAAIGHEIDLSLVELAADMRASTPSNAAELLTPDKRDELRYLSTHAERMHASVSQLVADERDYHDDTMTLLHDAIERQLADRTESLSSTAKLLEALSPQAALRRGYSVIRDGHGNILGGAAGMTPREGDIVRMQMLQADVEAEVRSVLPIVPGTSRLRGDVHDDE
jgi:exodeoxyribonuclease VII large subunit